MTQPGDLHVDLTAVVNVLRRRIDALTYENAVLSAAVDQLQARVNEQGGGRGAAGDHSR
ncbi:hypothetical protein [Spongiactinospora sp. TRM90649]|uniref:hypothetical protein n=1 Tax=Spongiactinospora sp. TRM90649 TaxID=3031114 RepID=UPI0023F7C140|nr:hypothetical protein [Spongiactinospora sp. TRM90649]MDF5756668.1 hypothetical protein [Spongiactinospora sp. TRM90649]